MSGSPRCRRFRPAVVSFVTVALVAAGISIGGCGADSGLTRDFSIAATPAAVSLNAGAAGQMVTVSVAGANGFTSAVNVSVSGLANGVTAQPSSFTLSPGTPQTVMLSAATTAAASSGSAVFTGISGSLSHGASVMVNVAAAPPPDFSLAIQPTSLSLTTGAAAQPISISVSAVNGFSGTVSVSVAGLPSGVTVTPTTVTVAPGTPEAMSFAAAADAAIGNANVTVTGQSGSLSHSAPLGLTVAAPAGNDVVTYHYDNGRSGLNANETTLTTANVNSATFGKLMLLSVDGKVDGEPLYLSAVTIGGQVRNVLYVVTEHDSVYAFDADKGTQLWKVSAFGSGETTSDSHGCGQITPEIGITSTPVIDRRNGQNGTLFAVAMTKDAAGNYHQRLHALDVTTGAELAGSPTEISATYPGMGEGSSNGNVVFAPGQYAERVGLLMMNQTIYLGWTSHCDIQPYTGWMMAYSESTLKQTAVLDLTPNGSEGSIWMSGAGLAGDSSGNIYFLDANGTLDTSLSGVGYPVNGDFGNGMLKVSTANGSLTVADYFEPFNTVNESNSDEDLGSGGALLLPDLKDATGTVRHLMVGAGKDGNIYLGDRDNLGKFNSANNNDLYQELPGALPGGVWSMPAYFNGTLYYGAVSDHLRAFPIANAKLASAPSSMSAKTFGYPGATPSVSANGTSNGIVWALESGEGSTAVLHAFDATDLTKELYNSNQAAGARDNFGAGNKFLTPMVINGKVYVGTPNAVAVFGLLP